MSDRVDRFPVPVDGSVPTGKTNTYLVHGDEPVLVDPAGRTPALDTAIADTPPAHIVLTHTHPDHLGGVVAYGMQTDADIWALHGAENALAAAIDLYPGSTFRDGDRIGPLTAITTPGHAPDHVAYELEEEQTAIFCGDLAIEPGSVFVGGQGADMAVYLRSLRLLADRDPDVLYPGHGEPITDPAGTIERLIRHRLDRERRIYEAVADGARDPDAIVEAAYDKDLSGVRDLARLSTIAHLEKLAAEGQLAWDGSSADVL